ncbi:MAG: 30S ribosome-binding factor RbfA [Deltaproteobacteria bacterium]|jgi:ribosome-binding factor A|nr:30S ribosome-binding factor RbfA [Deltaproteobacteria bacterium]
MSQRRLEKVNRLLMAQVAELLLFHSDDPRLKPVTVTRAQVSADLGKAVVFFSVLGDENGRLGAERALKKATGFIRSRLAGTLGLRAVPELTFVFDRNPSYAQRIVKVLAELKSEPGAANPDAGSEPGSGSSSPSGSESGSKSGLEPSSDLGSTPGLRREVGASQGQAERTESQAAGQGQAEKAASQGQAKKAAIQGQTKKAENQGQPKKAASQGQTKKAENQGQPNKAASQSQAKKIATSSQDASASQGRLDPLGEPAFEGETDLEVES